jgi:hypothetical protein
MNKIIILFISCITGVFFYACNDDFENYSDNPNDRLAFSTDTVAFDTIITTINTPYRYFKVYNPNKKALLISSIQLKNGTGSAFKINVDGRAGISFPDVEIRAGDSIFVLVDAKPAKNFSNLPEYHTDSIVFITNGVQQHVLLEASTQDAVIWRGFRITDNVVLSNAKPFVIYDSLVVEAGRTLHLKAGTTFYMHGNAEIILKGRLQAKGTLEKPVVIRGDRFDSYVDISYDRVPGQWGGIRIESESFQNELENVRIRNGKYGFNCLPSDDSQSKLKLKNVVMTNFKGVLLNSVNCKIEAENCELSNAKDGILNLTGGSYRFTHCTIANYYMSNQEAGWGNSNNETVQLRIHYWNETAEATESYPIQQADFYNTIIWGQGSGSDVAIESADSIRSYFQNCVIPNKDATNDDPNDPNITPQVVNCLIHTDPEFLKTRSDDLSYDFRLDSISPARNMANPNFSQTLPLDLDGVSRFSEDAPDMGCYEFVSRKD